MMKLKGWLGLGMGVVLWPMAPKAALIVIDKPVALEQVSSTTALPSTSLHHASSAGNATSLAVGMTSLKYSAINESAFPRIMFNGQAPDSFIPGLSGQGRGVTIAEAGRQIIPHSFSVRVGNDIKSQQKVSWVASAHWLSTLHNLLAKEDLIASVDYMKNEVLIDKAKPNVVTPAVNHQMAGSPSPSTPPGFQRISVSSNSTEQTTARSSDVPASAINAQPSLVKATPITIPQWEVKAGDTLQDTLKGWAKAERWEVVWDANVDYPIESSFHLRGDFLTAVKTIFALYEKAERPLFAAGYSSQRLILVSDKRIEK